MKRNVLVVAVLACLALMVAVTPAQAQRRGGFGGAINNWGNNTFGGWGGNYGYGNYGWGGYGYNQPGWGLNQGYYSHPYAGNYYNNPGYYYGSNTPAYPNQGYGFAQPNNSGFYTSAPSTGQQSFYSGPGQDDNQAMIHILVPSPNARVWIEGQEMQQNQQGTERTFISPPLQRGSNYIYTIKAAWDENGRQVTRERKLPVTAGQHVSANFMEGEQGQRSPTQFNNQQQERQQLQTQPADQRNNQPEARPADQRTQTDRNRQPQQQQPQDR